MGKGKVSPQLRRQISRLSDETVFPKTETRPIEEMATEKSVADENEKAISQQAIEQLKIQKETWAKKRIKEIEEEVRILAQKRQEEMRKRYEQKIEEDKQKEVAAEKVKKEQPVEMTSKPKKGLPFWGRRIKTAQQQAQPETAGRRVGG